MLSSISSHNHIVCAHHTSQKTWSPDSEWVLTSDDVQSLQSTAWASKVSTSVCTRSKRTCFFNFSGCAHILSAVTSRNQSVLTSQSHVVRQREVHVFESSELVHIIIASEHVLSVFVVHVRVAQVLWSIAVVCVKVMWPGEQHSPRRSERVVLGNESVGIWAGSRLSWRSTHHLCRSVSRIDHWMQNLFLVCFSMTNILTRFHLSRRL